MCTVPADRMNAGRGTPGAAVARGLVLLRFVPSRPDNSLAFATPRGEVLSDMTLAAGLWRMSFAVPAMGGKVEAAYRRGDSLGGWRRLTDKQAALLNPANEQGDS